MARPLGWAGAQRRRPGARRRPPNVESLTPGGPARRREAPRSRALRHSVPVPTRPPPYGVVVLPPEGAGTFTRFEDRAAAVAHADRAIPGHPGSRAWIAELGDGRVDVLGVRGAGTWDYNRVPHHRVAPTAGGAIEPYESYEQARARAGPGTILFTLLPSGEIVFEEVA
jgi:hypothetical protein